MQKTRTHYQDQLKLTSHVYPIKKASEESGSNGRGRKNKNSGGNHEAKMGMTNLLLIINNWNYVRDTQNQPNVKKCTPSDFQVQLKISSTAFRNASNPDCEFPFDKQAANFPYDSFLQLHQSRGVKKFIQEVKETYLAVEGKFPGTEEEDDAEADEEEEEEDDLFHTEESVNVEEDDAEVSRILNRKTPRRLNVSPLRPIREERDDSGLDSESREALESGNLTPPPPPKKRAKRCLQNPAAPLPSHLLY